MSSAPLGAFPTWPELTSPTFLLPPCSIPGFKGRSRPIPGLRSAHSFQLTHSKISLPLSLKTSLPLSTALRETEAQIGEAPAYKSLERKLTHN